jgi:RHS repeat-associated protein
LTGDGTYTYQWDAEGRLISVNSGVDRSYVYNALGREVEWHGDGRVSEDLTDLAGHYLGSVDPSSGAWTGERIPGSRIYLAWYVNGGTTFFHYNALGSSMMNTHQDGNTVSNDVLFYPWGQMWASPVNDYFQFFGNIEGWDWEIGEGVTPNRYYPNYQGRWLSPDPLAGDISNPQSLNRYAYVLNNPTTLTDPTGLSDCGNTDYPCNNYNGEPPVGGGHYNGNGGGSTGFAGGASTDDPLLCSNLATNDASCATYAGLWGNGQPIYGPPQVGGDSVGGWLGGGGSVWSENTGLGPIQPLTPGQLLGLALPQVQNQCEFGSCGGITGPPGNGFGPGALAIPLAVGACAVSGVCEAVVAGIAVGTLVGLAAAEIQNVYESSKTKKERENAQAAKAQYDNDIAVCRGLSDPGARSRCYESALNRKNRREQGWDPLPPLITW